MERYREVDSLGDGERTSVDALLVAGSRKVHGARYAQYLAELNREEVQPSAN